LKNEEMNLKAREGTEEKGNEREGRL